MTGLVLSFVLTAVRAIVIKIMWSWFMVPLGIIPLGFWHTIGLLYLWALAHGVDLSDVKYSDDEKLVLKGLAYNVVVAFLALGVGWVAKSFMG